MRYMAGLTKPRGRCASWSASATSPAQKGAAALGPVAGRTMAWPAEATGRPGAEGASPGASGTPRGAAAPETPARQPGRANRWLNPPPEAEEPSPGDGGAGRVFHAVSPI